MLQQLKFLIAPTDCEERYSFSFFEMAAQSIRVGTGMPLQSRLLWYFGWNQRPLYILAVVFGLIGAVKLGSVYGFLFGVIPLGVCILAIQEIKKDFPEILANAKAAVARSGAERVGIPFEGSDCAVFAVPSAPSQMLLPAPSHTFSCVYISDVFFAVFSGSSFDLANRAVQLASTAEEIYFRHVSSINQQDGFIEINQTRAKPKRIPVGNDANVPRLLEILRARLRKPGSVDAAIPQFPVEPAIVHAQAMHPTSMPDDERYCYIRASKLNDYYADPVVVDALMERLEVPGTVATHRMMPLPQKRLAIEAQINHFRNTPSSFWYGVQPSEILAASIWRCRGDSLSLKVIHDKFYEVAREDDLRRPVARWLQSRGYEPYMEIQLGRRRIDVLGRGNDGRLTAVELKNSDEEFRRGPDQMQSFSEYTHAVYLACTPAFAADYLERNAAHRAVNHWDATLLDRKLKQGGFGLLIVERDSVFEAIKPVDRTPPCAKVAKIVGSLSAFHKIDLD